MKLRERDTRPQYIVCEGYKPRDSVDLGSSLPEKLLEHKGPHFKAPQIEFHEFMGIIVANFFGEHDDCKDMLRNLGL